MYCLYADVCTVCMPMYVQFMYTGQCLCYCTLITLFCITTLRCPLQYKMFLKIKYRVISYVISLILPLCVYTHIWNNYSSICDISVFPALTIICIAFITSILVSRYVLHKNYKYHPLSHSQDCSF